MIAFAVALACVLPATVAGGQASLPLVAVDADTSGNGPRTVGSIQDCVSADVGQPVDVDIVVPDPGVPADRGIAAYQFNLLYDPEVVWVQADDPNMLLAQAPGSDVIPIADPKPDSNGLYLSWGVDFGPSGVEPEGSSEIGPGVLARLTLIPQSAGSSNLTLSGVLLIDDEVERIDLGSVEAGAIHAGEACPDEADAAPAPQGAGPSPTPTPSDPADSDPPPESDTDDPASQAGVESSPEGGAAEAVPTAGGPPPVGGNPIGMIAAGAALSLTGVAIALAAVSRRARGVEASSLTNSRQ